MRLKPNHWRLTGLLWLGVIPAWGSLCSVAAAVTPIDPKILHVLNRLSFGPRPGDVQMVAQMGVDRYIQQQLAPDSIPISQPLTEKLAQLEALNLTPPELLAQYEPVKAANGQNLTPDERKHLRQQARMVMQQAIQARLLRATASPRQLEEVMVDFWYNHFNVFAGKGIDRLLVGAYEQQAIRPYAIGRFRDLLGATAHHPAMLFYLDNWQNTAPNSPGARGRFTGLNENYARELMELHTLGVEGGYSQQDVITLAKIFTGWGFRRNGQSTDRTTGFYFDPKRHDASDKVFLGYNIKGGGAEEGEKALDILAKSPATARHISYELAQYFVSDTPPKLLVDRLTKHYLSTNGDLRAVLKALFHSPEFWQTQYYSAKFKTPYQYLISAVRATGIEIANVQPLASTLQQLGMPLYGCLTPDGYKNTQAVWLNPEAITRRISFATTLASGRLPLRAIAPSALSLLPPTATTADSASSLAQIPPVAPAPTLTLQTPSRVQPLDETQLAATLGYPFSAKTQQTIATNPTQLRAALMLGSPEFMYK